MKNAMLKNAFKEIKKSKSRFLSIFGIVAIGVGFFSGISASAPDMELSANKYYSESNLMDFRLLCTYGFDDKDIDAIKAMSVTQQVYPSYYLDVVTEQNNEDKVARVYSLDKMGENNEVNKLDLVEGRFPEKNDECIVDASKLMQSYSIGDTITLESGKDEVDLADSISNQTYTIVGKANSPMFISDTQRGNATIGNGSVAILVYIPQDNFTVDYYTQVYITVDELNAFECYGDDYIRRVNSLKEQLETVGNSRKADRYSEITEDLNQKIDDGESEIIKGENELKTQLTDGQEKLDTTKAELDLAKENLDYAREQLDAAKAEIEANYGLIFSSDADIDEQERLFYEQMATLKTTLEEKSAELTAARTAYETALKEYDDNYALFKPSLEEYNTGYAEYTTALDDYNYNVGLYNDGKTAYETSLAQYDAYISAKNQYETGIDEFDSAMSAYETALSDYESNVGSMTDEQAQAAKDALDTQKATLDATKIKLDNTKTELDALAPTMEGADATLEATRLDLENTKTQLDEAKTALDDTKSQLDEAKKPLDTKQAEFDVAKSKLDETNQQISDGETELAQGQTDYDTAYAEGEEKIKTAREQAINGANQYDSAVIEYNENETQYSENLAEYEKGVKDYEKGIEDFKTAKTDGEKKLADAKKTLNNAKAQMRELSEPVWYVFDRNDNPAYTEYSENADRINNISKIFPVFFLLVAGLVCLTTMTRMVEEQRTQIGTLKALGYSSGSIIFKYMLYALFATVVGAVIGLLIGQQLFPRVIIQTYGMMYKIPTIVTPYMLDTALGSIVVCIVAIAITVYFSCKNVLREQPAQLMRPKVPKTGKRILLEHIGFIWRKLNFSAKVSSRNIFRYKRRMLMTVVGVAGCTALVLTGFGLYDSISDIANMQFNKIDLYDGIVTYNSSKMDEKQMSEVDSIIAGYNGTSITVYEKKTDAESSTRKNDSYLVVTDNADKLGEFISLQSRTGNESYKLDDNGVIIDEKLSTLLNVKVGDKIEVYITDTQKSSVAISAITENYAQHYIYMTKNLYKTLHNSTPENNVIYFKGGTDDENGFCQKMLNNSAIMSCNFKMTSAETFSNMTKTLSMVVLVLICSAGALAFIVLYNLTNININERIREIATLKVLGFYDREVSGYIFRENVILTLMGTALGLVLGRFLTDFVVKTAEIDLVMFGREVYPLSYIISALLTIVFAIMVSLFMHRHLIKISMVESLKSVE